MVKYLSQVFARQRDCLATGIQNSESQLQKNCRRRDKVMVDALFFKDESKQWYFAKGLKNFKTLLWWSSLYFELEKVQIYYSFNKIWHKKQMLSFLPIFNGKSTELSFKLMEYNEIFVDL